MRDVTWRCYASANLLNVKKAFNKNRFVFSLEKWSRSPTFVTNVQSYSFLRPNHFFCADCQAIHMMSVCCRQSALSKQSKQKKFIHHVFGNSRLKLHVCNKLAKSLFVWDPTIFFAQIVKQYTWWQYVVVNQRYQNRANQKNSSITFSATQDWNCMFVTN